VRGDVKIWKEKSAKRKEVRQKRKDVVILQGHTFPSSKALETLWSFCVICKVACVVASRAVLGLPLPSVMGKCIKSKDWKRKWDEVKEGVSLPSPSGTWMGIVDASSSGASRFDRRWRFMWQWEVER